jgi:hypothetical protein
MKRTGIVGGPIRHSATGVRGRTHEGALNKKGTAIMKLTTITQVFVDGVMQGNGGRDPDIDPGFECTQRPELPDHRTAMSNQRR